MTQHRPELLWERPALRPIAPLVLSAWEDGSLTPAELLAVRAELERAAWLEDDTRAALHGWLDPSSPPSAPALRALERHVARWADELSKPRARSLRELGSALAERDLSADVRPQAHALLDGLASTSADSARVPRGETARRTHEPRALAEDEATLVGSLRALLDGRYAAIRDEVRDVLRDPTFRFTSELKTDAYREQVLAWCRELAARGLSQRAYPQLGASNDMGEFIATFETLAFFDLSLVVKFGVQFGLFGGAIAGLGSAQHHALLPAIARSELLGCFAMTERAHGSNVRDLRTTATYDASSEEFVIHSPDLGAGKEWIGNAALHGTMAVVFAQLQTGGEQYGVHAFLVPIRDEHGTFLKGVRGEDCGEKMGLNGVDNGRLWFDQVRVAREALLDRFGKVLADGTYESPIPSAGKRFFRMLGTLIGGRISVAGAAVSASKVGLTIALSYAQHRTQFPGEDDVERPLLEYLSHQRRLIPALSAAYALSFAQNELVRRFASSVSAEHDGGEARELETLAAGLKALATWQATDTLQQCRESCGGQGYLTSNRIDALRTDTDVFTTFEGDNTVLSQLVARELLSAYGRAFKEQPVRTLATTVATRLKTSLVEQNPLATRRAGEDELLSFDFHARALRFRERSLLESLAQRIQKRVRGGQSQQAAFEACQDHALSLARAHVEHFALTAFQTAASEHPGLEPLCSLYGLWCVERDLAWFLENDYVAASKSRAVRKQLNDAVRALHEQVPVLIAAFGIPDACLGPLADPCFLFASGLVSSPHSHGE